MTSIEALGDQDINSRVSDVQEYMANARRFTKNNTDSLDLNIHWPYDSKTGKTANPLLSYMDGPEKQVSFCNYIAHMVSIVDGVKGIITTFRVHYMRHLDQAFIKGQINSQIGIPNSTSSSLYAENIRRIRDMQRMAGCPVSY